MSQRGSIIDIDEVIEKGRQALLRVSASQHSAVKLPRAEIELLTQFELIRDALVRVLANASDRSELRETYGGDCTRIAKVRAILDNTNLSETRVGDQRWQMCLNACLSVERVLDDLGLGATLRQAKAAQVEVLAQQARRASLLQSQPTMPENDDASNQEISYDGKNDIDCSPSIEDELPNEEIQDPEPEKVQEPESAPSQEELLSDETGGQKASPTSESENAPLADESMKEELPSDETGGQNTSPASESENAPLADESMKEELPSDETGEQNASPASESNSAPLGDESMEVSASPPADEEHFVEEEVQSTDNEVQEVEEQPGCEDSNFDDDLKTFDAICERASIKGEIQWPEQESSSQVPCDIMPVDDGIMLDEDQEVATDQSLRVATDLKDQTLSEEVQEEETTVDSPLTAMPIEVESPYIDVTVSEEDCEKVLKQLFLHYSCIGVSPGLTAPKFRRLCRDIGVLGQPEPPRTSSDFPAPAIEVVKPLFKLPLKMNWEEIKLELSDVDVIYNCAAGQSSRALIHRSLVSALEDTSSKSLHQRARTPEQTMPLLCQVLLIPLAEALQLGADGPEVVAALELLSDKTTMVLLNKSQKGLLRIFERYASGGDSTAATMQARRKHWTLEATGKFRTEIMLEAELSNSAVFEIFTVCARRQSGPKKEYLLLETFPLMLALMAQKARGKLDCSPLQSLAVLFRRSSGALLRLGAGSRAIHSDLADLGSGALVVPGVRELMSGKVPRKT